MHCCSMNTLTREFSRHVHTNEYFASLFNNYLSCNIVQSHPLLFSSKLGCHFYRVAQLLEKTIMHILIVIRTLHGKYILPNYTKEKCRSCGFELFYQILSKKSRKIFSRRLCKTAERLSFQNIGDLWRYHT